MLVQGVASRTPRWGRFVGIAQTARAAGEKLCPRKGSISRQGATGASSLGRPRAPCLSPQFASRTLGIDSEPLRTSWRGLHFLPPSPPSRLQAFLPAATTGNKGSHQHICCAVRIAAAANQRGHRIMRDILYVYYTQHHWRHLASRCFSAPACGHKDIILVAKVIDESLVSK